MTSSGAAVDANCLGTRRAATRNLGRDSFPGRRPRNQILFMNRIDHIRALARSLRGLPPVSLSEIARHWAVDPDTARRVLRAKGVSPTPGPWGRRDIPGLTSGGSTAFRTHGFSGPKVKTR